MKTFTINLRHGIAIIQELLNGKIPWEDQEGSAVWSADNNMEALGYAMTYLGTVEDLDEGVRLVITEQE